MDPLIALHRAESDRICATARRPLVATNNKYTAGVYPSLTENLTLLAELTDTKAEAHNGVENNSSNFNVAACLSF